MIEEVRIEQGVVFEQADLRLSAHLNVISGASGSGKSVLLGCILASVGLAPMRARFLQARWQLANTPTVIQIHKHKRARCMRDGAPISKKALQSYLAPHLLYISSHARPLNPQLFLEILDSFIDPTLLQAFQQSYKRYTHARAQLDKLEQEADSLEVLKEMARFELAKFEGVLLEDGAYARLENLKNQHKNCQKSRAAIKQGLGVLEGEHHIYRALSCTNAPFKDALQEHLQEAKGWLLNEMCALEELEHMDMEALLDAMGKLGSLVRKYGSEALARAKQQSLRQDYQRYCAHDQHLKSAQTRVQECEHACMQLGSQLSKERQIHLSAVQSMLESYTTPLLLNPPHLSLEPTPLCAQGLESVRLLLGRSAHWSAGESNRLSLALLALQAKQQQTPHKTLLVDELDANLSGQESACVAQILKELSAHHQVIAISHAPHLPGLANRHFLVYQHAQQASIKLLSKDEQVLEIARMVDANLGQEALAYAKMKLNYD
ncbi:DNA repair protein RecN [Helicobacter labacensis]|uniref:DNA repair protein n=1 Tax=Helicobacter labacensis TaxID=2316079 RepID=UPI000EB2DD6F|nr:DNA repair protein [Helicobacter labacensis]